MIPDTPLERAALVTWHLAHGEGLTTSQVAAMTKMSWDGAHKLLNSISRVIPIYQDDKRVWQVCSTREEY